MNRHHAYGNGHSTYPRAREETSTSSHRFQPRSQPLRKRKQLVTRLTILGGVSFLILLIFFPSSRSALYSSFHIGVSSGVEDLQLETVRYYDLSEVGGTARGWEHEERVLLCAPLRDAEAHLPMFFAHLRNFTYPHHLIDLAFLVSDSKDNTLSLLNKLLSDLQADSDPRQPYGEISILEKDFGQKVNQDVESRHGFAAQASRRKLMAQARNWLLSAALRPTHSWVYWRDVDVETAPFTILEDLMRHNKDVIVPNVWRPLPDWLGGEQPYDLNSWQESETALALAESLDEDAVIVEGYAEYATWRPHLAYLRDPYGDPDMEMEIDGVGGVSILAKAKVFRSGVHFPAFSFEKHAETEGFGKMAKRMGFSVVGLPHYTVWHLYEPSVDDIRHMQEMEQERKNRENEERERAERIQKIKEEFIDPGSQWEKDKNDIEGMTVKDKEVKKSTSHVDPLPADHAESQASREKGESSGGKTVERKQPSGTKADEASKDARKTEGLAEDPDAEPRKNKPESEATKEASKDKGETGASSKSKAEPEADKVGVPKKAGSSQKSSSLEDAESIKKKSQVKKIPAGTGADHAEDEESQPRKKKSERVVKADKGA